MVVKGFTERRTGVYRIRFRYRGSATVAKGQAIVRGRITRRVFFG